MGKINLKKVAIPNGEEIAFRIGGSGSETLVLVHGNLVSSRHWGTLLERLSEKFRVIAIDMRGAGLSSYNNPIETFKDWSNDLRLFCDEMGIKDFTLLGWSMGGGVSQQFVIDNPRYAKKLILFESVPCSGYPYRKQGPNGEFLEEYYDNKENLLKDSMQLKPMIDGLETRNRDLMRQLWDMLVLNVNTPEEAEYEALIDDILMTRNLKDAAWAAHIFNISHINKLILNCLFPNESLQILTLNLK